MPHKRNPVVSARTLACAASARAHAARSSRPSRTSTSGRPARGTPSGTRSRGRSRAQAGAAAAVASVLAGLEVDAARMRRNLDLTGGLVMAERVAFARAARVGLGEAQRLVAEAAGRTGAEDVTFRQALADIGGAGPALDEIDAALDPAAGLESAAALVDRVLDGGESA